MHADANIKVAVPQPGIGGKRFLHVVPDNKFIDDVVVILEEVSPGSHDYVFLGEASDFEHLRRCAPFQSTLWEATRSKWFDELFRYDAVFVHFLNQVAREFVDAARSDTRFVWLGWGGDYYHLVSGPDLLSPSTRALLSSLRQTQPPKNPFRTRIFNFLKSPRHRLREDARQRRARRIAKNGDQELAFLNRFDAFAPVLEEEYNAIRIAHPDFKPELASWNYWTPADEMLSSASCRGSGQKILLGNSATPENNHLDAMALLAPLLPPQREIICPLSYGNSAYAEAIAQAGLGLFGARFRALRDYLPTSDYLDLLRSCDIAAMNHVRQQALGNIILMLWLGSHVFLNRSSPINSEMSRLGVKVHDIREIGDFIKQGHERITGEKLQDVRARLDARFGRDAVIGMTRSLLRVRHWHQSESGL